MHRYNNSRAINEILILLDKITDPLIKGVCYDI